IDLKTRHVETLRISGLEKLLPRSASARPKGPSTSKRKLAAIELPSQSVSPVEASLRIALEMPSGLKLNLEGPSEVTVTVGNEALLILASAGFRLTVPVRIPKREPRVPFDF